MSHAFKARLLSRSKYSEKVKYSESVAKTVKVIVLPYYYSVLQLELGM